MRRIVLPLLVAVLVIGVAYGGSLKPKAGPVVMPLDYASTPVISALSDFSPASPTSGVLTGLNGFYDYQSNGGACQFIRVDPTTGAIHTVMMVADDSTNISSSRRSAYSYSTDDGATWNTFNNVRVPARTAGFPEFDLGKGAIDGAAIIVNHNDGGSGTQWYSYVDFPAGGGAFAELSALPVPDPSFPPIWPYVAGASDGSIVVIGSTQAATGDVWISRTTDFTTWSTPFHYPGTNSSGGRYPIYANNNGRVGALLQGVTLGTFFIESTDNGATWSSASTEIHPAAPPGRIAPPDTFQAWVCADFVYNGDTPMFVVDELGIGANDPTSSGYIAFYSTATGWVEIARPANTPGAVTEINKTIVNYFTLGYPTIGMSGSDLVVAFNAMQADTGADGFNFSDIYMCKSTDGGMTWSSPHNVSNTPNVDERYPAISKWNPQGFAYVAWMADNVPGNAAFNGTFEAAPISRAWQEFSKVSLDTLTAVREQSTVANTFKLEQNYPNPFNPVTKIGFSVPTASDVQLDVYNTLGQKVATLINGRRERGTYEADFSGANLSSGIYFYTLRAGSFVESKKMVLLK